MKQLRCGHSCAGASQPTSRYCSPATVCAQLTDSAWRLQPAGHFGTLGCLVFKRWAWRDPEFGTGFEAQTWLLPRPVFIGWRRTSSNPSIKLPCSLARGLNINQWLVRSHSHTTSFGRCWTPHHTVLTVKYPTLW